MSIPFFPRNRTAWVIAAAGLIVLLLCIRLGASDPAQGWGAYLVAYLFWLGLALGAMALTMIHIITDGTWGYLLRPQLKAAMHTLPLLALALLPLLFNANHLFIWMQSTEPDTPQALRQAWYLNESFWQLRSLIFMILWLMLMFALLRYLDSAPQARFRIYLAVIGMMIYTLSASLFSVDWIMALEPRWSSSVFGLTFIVTQLLAALAWAVLFFVGSSDVTGKERDHLGDLGSLLMATLLGFSYLVFMDYLTAWSGDLPSETIWYIPRTLTSWKLLAGAGIVGGLLVPFACLLSRRFKRSTTGLRFIATLLLVGNAIFVAWLILPSLRRDGLWFGLGDLLTFVGLGALWWSVFSSAMCRPDHIASNKSMSLNDGASP